MGKLFPDTIHGKIDFVQSKVSVWGSVATGIGTTTGAVTAMGTKATTAAAKLAAAIIARDAAKAATADLDAAVAAMCADAADIVKQIRAKAATDGDNVYVLAQIPAPLPPSPVGAPGTPTDFKAGLNPNGSLVLDWKCPNPTRAKGTVYQVERRVGATGPFVAIAMAGKRRYVDATVPAGATSVTYQVTAVRSTALGTAAQFTVNLGCVGGESAAAAAKVAA